MDYVCFSIFSVCSATRKVLFLILLVFCVTNFHTLLCNLMYRTRIEYFYNFAFNVDTLEFVNRSFRIFNCN